MPSSGLRILILGAGPAGVGSAFRLVRSGRTAVTVVERHGVVGGHAGSFEVAGQIVDFGSHRLHPACDPEVLADIRSLLGDDLLERPRHGRIRLHGRWIHFPLKPVDLALRLPPSFGLGVARDALRKVAGRGGGDAPDTFASVLEAGLGSTICRDFYFPYAQKIWGLPATELGAVQARRRVRAGSLGRLARRVLDAVPGFTRPGAGRFFYPRHGYGSISEAYHRAASKGGASFVMNAAVSEVHHEGDRVVAAVVDREGQPRRIDADHIWSTIPVSFLIDALRPAAPADVVAAARALEFRAMLLVYLVLEREQFTAYDAHYFPEPHIRISRLSEPKNYSLTGPRGRTVPVRRAAVFAAGFRSGRCRMRRSGRWSPRAWSTPRSRSAGRPPGWLFVVFGRPIPSTGSAPTTSSPWSTATSSHSRTC